MVPASIRLRRSSGTALAAAATALALAACGGSAGSRTTSSSSTPTTSSAPSPTTTATTSSPGSSARSARMRARLVGEDHRPVVNRPWRYTVTVADTAGRPLSGTVDIEFTFAGAVVGHDTPPTHPVHDGRWSDTLVFPPASVGKPLDVQAVVHTALGSLTLAWPITVQR